MHFIKTFYINSLISKLRSLNGLEKKQKKEVFTFFANNPESFDVNLEVMPEVNGLFFGKKAKISLILELPTKVFSSASLIILAQSYISKDEVFERLDQVIDVNGFIGVLGLKVYSFYFGLVDLATFGPELTSFFKFHFFKTKKLFSFRRKRFAIVLSLSRKRFICISEMFSIIAVSSNFADCPKLSIKPFKMVFGYIRTLKRYIVS